MPAAQHCRSSRPSGLTSLADLPQLFMPTYPSDHYQDNPPLTLLVRVVARSRYSIFTLFYSCISWIYEVSEWRDVCVNIIKWRLQESKSDATLQSGAHSNDKRKRKEKSE